MSQAKIEDENRDLVVGSDGRLRKRLVLEPEVQELLDLGHAAADRASGKFPRAEVEHESECHPQSLPAVDEKVREISALIWSKHRVALNRDEFEAKVLDILNS